MPLTYEIIYALPLNATGPWITTGASGYLYESTTLGNHIFELQFTSFGNCINLNSSPNFIPFAGLPSGFTPVSANVQVIDTGGGANPPSSFSFLFGSDTLTLGGYVPEPHQYGLTYAAGNIPSIQSLYGRICNVIVNSISPEQIHYKIGENDSAGGFPTLFLIVSGNYIIDPNTSPITTITNTAPVRVGDKITVTGGGLDGITYILLTYLNSIGIPVTTIIPSWDIIVQQPNLLVFYLSPCGIVLNYSTTLSDLPSALAFVASADQAYVAENLDLNNAELCLGTFSGYADVTVVGNGVQFTGSVDLGFINILFANVSGIYNLVRGQTNDVLYFRAGYTTDPELLFLQFISEEDKSESPAAKASEDSDFYAMLSYPSASMAQTEEQDYEDMTVTGAARVVVITESVEIPSPFVQTSFLP